MQYNKGTRAEVLTSRKRAREEMGILALNLWFIFRGGGSRGRRRRRRRRIDTSETM